MLERIESKPEILQRRGEIIQEVQEWRDDDIIYLVEELIEILQK